MTIFAKRPMNVTDWAKVQNQIGDLQMAMAAPHDLMMFSADTNSMTEQDIFIGLPNSVPLSAFPGFIKIDQNELPDFLCTLIVREDGFSERFPDIAAKRRTRYG